MTTQIETLDEYFLMVMFTLVLNGAHDFIIFVFNLNKEAYFIENVLIIALSSGDTLKQKGLNHSE